METWSVGNNSFRYEIGQLDMMGGFKPGPEVPRWVLTGTTPPGSPVQLGCPRHAAGRLRNRGPPSYEDFLPPPPPTPAWWGGSDRREGAAIAPGPAPRRHPRSVVTSPGPPPRRPPASFAKYRRSRHALAPAETSGVGDDERSSTRRQAKIEC